MLRGVIGYVHWSYYRAAAVHGYTVARAKDRRTWSLVAILGTADAFKMSQRPLTFVATHKKGEWRWPIVSHSVDVNKRLTATLGPLQETP